MKEQIKQYFPFVTWAMVGGLIWFVAKSDGRIFSSEKIKYATEDHVESAKTERELYETLDVLDTVAEFTKKDSEENLIRDQQRDSLVKRNAVTIYQMKVQQEKIDSLLRQYIKIHDQ